MGKYALLIGVGEYGEGLQPLPAAPNDVAALKKVLEDPKIAGFDEVKEIVNPTHAEMAREIELWFQGREPEDLVLLFFSGHGVKDDSRELYFASRNTEKVRNSLLISTATSARFVSERIRRCKAKQLILILDCCFSGAFGDLVGRDSGEVDLQDQLGAEGRVVLTSTSAVDYSFEEKETDCSIYTRYLVEGIATGAADEDGDGFITVAELHRYAGRKVEEVSPAMSPQIFMPQGEGYLIRLAFSSQNDPKLKYRKEAEKRATQGHFSIPAQNLLKFFRRQLAISDTDAEEIETEVLKPYREYQRKLEEYRSTLIESLNAEEVLSQATITDLIDYRKHLALKPSDVNEIEQDLLGKSLDINDLLSPLPQSAINIHEANYEFSTTDDLFSPIREEHSESLEPEPELDLESPEILFSDFGDLDFEVDAEIPKAEWFLGIDLGTTGLSAVLMERISGLVYPFGWESRDGLKIFRISAIEALRFESDQRWELSDLSAIGAAPTFSSLKNAPAGLLNSLRPLLKIGIPHKTTVGAWEPTIQWTENYTLSLQHVLVAVQYLLSLIFRAEGLEAVGLESDALESALNNLQGVVVGIPTNWSDTYRLNVREAVLAARVIDSPEKIFFLEEAIAAVLSGLPNPNAPLPKPNDKSQGLYACNWQHGTVVINGGASCTEVGIVDIPEPLDTLNREDFELRNLAYGGDALDLDIICQLLIPAERHRLRNSRDIQASHDTYSWKAGVPEVANTQWESLQLDTFDLPKIAEPDINTRIRLRQHLESSVLGQNLLEAARHVKLILQNQNLYQLELADQSWRVLRRDLESRVLVPYIQRINQQVNALLAQSGLASQDINQVICTGGNASFNTIAKWLRQKFPNATIVQDTYPRDRPQTCSRIAYGLVNLIRYPQVMDVSRHQYSDYFLLHEIIRVVPEAPLPFDGILHLLREAAGINTALCQSRIKAILEGYLPPGLIPDASTQEFLDQSTLNSKKHRKLANQSLFIKQTQHIYMLNTHMRNLISDYLANIILYTNQSLAQPRIFNLTKV